MKDHDFDKYVDYADYGFKFPNNKGNRETNDNYNENINSKWNTLLTIIENQISVMPETGRRELETLRTMKNKK